MKKELFLRYTNVHYGVTASKENIKMLSFELKKPKN